MISIKNKNKRKKKIISIKDKNKKKEKAISIKNKKKKKKKMISIKDKIKVIFDKGKKKESEKKRRWMIRYTIKYTKFKI